MLSNIGVPGLILILVIALVIFGPKKLPEIGRAIGQSLSEFKKSTKNLVDDGKGTNVDFIESNEKTKSINNDETKEK